MNNKPVNAPARDVVAPPAQRTHSPVADRPLSPAAGSGNAVAGTEPGTATGDQPRMLPYDDAFYVVRHLHAKMATADFLEGARVWMAVLREEHPEEYQRLLLELGQREEQPSA
jgi:ParB family chromosome partitioning protein